jgi:hypothetical protein
MQIAGAECVVCGQNVGVMRDGAGCETCQIVAHRACVENGTCPTCGRPFLPTAEVHARPSAALQAQLDRPSSVTVLGLLTLLGGAPIGAFIALRGLVRTATDSADGIASIVEGVLTMGVCVAVGLGLLRGHEWARRFYLWVSPLIMATDLVLGENQLLRQGFSAPLFVAQATIYSAWLFFLTRPPARAFFRRRHQG